MLSPPQKKFSPVYVSAHLILFSMSSTILPMFAMCGDASETGESCSTWRVRDPPRFIVPEPAWKNERRRFKTSKTTRGSLNLSSPPKSSLYLADFALRKNPVTKRAFPTNFSGESPTLFVCSHSMDVDVSL